MGIIILLSILLAVFVFLAVLGFIKDYDWDTGALALQVFGGAFAIANLIIIVILSIMALTTNNRTNKTKVQTWYDEMILTLDSTKEYISTITDDYARSVAVTNYNKDVKNFKLQIKNSKYNLDNGWINWYTCAAYKELDEDVVDYIK